MNKGALFCFTVAADAILSTWARKLSPRALIDARQLPVTVSGMCCLACTECCGGAQSQDSGGALELKTSVEAFPVVSRGLLTDHPQSSSWKEPSSSGTSAHGAVAQRRVAVATTNQHAQSFALLG